MQNITAKTTISEIVKAFPAHARTLDKLGIDYCCGGKVPLGNVCQEKGLDLNAVIALFSTSENVADPSLPDVGGMSLSALCDHISQVHHLYLREELPRLDFMTQKVALVHGEHEPRLLEVRLLFENFYEKVAHHTYEEDDQIFPQIRQLDAGEKEGSDSALNLSLKESLDKLQQEHDRTGAALAQFRTLTDDYTPPDWACNTFRALYDGLKRMEADMHQHVHKENNVLFPKVLAAL